MIHELLSVAELSRATGDDPLMLWSAQGLDGRARAWRSGDAVVVAVSDLARHDRLAVGGPAEEVAALLAHVFAEVGPAYKPFGDEGLIRELPDRLAGLRFRATFGWMDTRVAPGIASDARWIDDDVAVADLLAIASPGSYAQPGMVVSLDGQQLLRATNWRVSRRMRGARLVPVSLPGSRRCQRPVGVDSHSRCVDS